MEEKKVVGSAVCKVCGRNFPLIYEKRYTARDNEKSGVAMTLAGSESVLYDAIDCPHCGCQNILQTRKRVDTSECTSDYRGCEECSGCCEEVEY